MPSITWTLEQWRELAHSLADERDALRERVSELEESVGIRDDRIDQLIEQLRVADPEATLEDGHPAKAGCGLFFGAKASRPKTAGRK